MLVSPVIAQAMDTHQPRPRRQSTSGTLQQALERLGQVTGLNILYDPQQVWGHTAHEVEGAVTATAPACGLVDRWFLTGRVACNL
jgi:hypothetical protein